MECVYAWDVIEVARANKLYSGADKDFSFSDTYNPINFSGARFCEMRVWSFSGRLTAEWSRFKHYAAGA